MVSQCDGQGGITDEVDDFDLPDDGNPCTDDGCDGGSPTFTPTAAGTTCGAGLICDGDGACVGCLTADQCPGQDTECQTRTCVNNTCGFSYTPSGTALSAQMDGDCREEQCDGMGGVTSAALDTDLPVDGNECTEDLCAAGTPSNPPVAAGTPVQAQTPGDCQENQCDGAGGVTSAALDTDVPVDGMECTADLCTAGVPSNPPLPSGAGCSEGGGQYCDGAGACVECVVASTCPGQDTECQARTCAANACGFSYAPAGTVVSMQMAADCQVITCDGAGGLTSVADDTDLPIDGAQCTDDVCTAGAPSNPPLPSGAACNEGGGQYCDGAGACVECVVASTCPGQDTECEMRACVANACGFSYPPAGTPVSTQTPGDCLVNACDGAGGVTSVVSNLDVPVDGDDCTDDICTSGVPSNPLSALGTMCSGGMCDGAGACVPLLIAGVDYPVIAHGAQLVISGVGFTGATSVVVGGLPQAFVVDTDGQITVPALDDMTPIGAQQVQVNTPSGSTQQVDVTVIHLLITEVDSEMALQNMEFIEISAGVPGVNLTGYTLVFWNGANDRVYASRALSVLTDANGRILVGNSSLMPNIVFLNNILQPGPDALAVHQGALSKFPLNTPLTGDGVIDAIVYDTSDPDDNELLDVLITTDLLSPARVQVDENMFGMMNTHSIQRCGDGRRHGGKWAVGGPPTPKLDNNVVPCP
jgi:hypothetical protein